MDCHLTRYCLTIIKLCEITSYKIFAPIWASVRWINRRFLHGTSRCNSQSFTVGPRSDRIKPLEIVPSIRLSHQVREKSLCSPKSKGIQAEFRRLERYFRWKPPLAFFGSIFACLTFGINHFWLSIDFRRQRRFPQWREECESREDFPGIIRRRPGHTIAAARLIYMASLRKAHFFFNCPVLSNRNLCPSGVHFYIVLTQAQPHVWLFSMHWPPSNSW